MTIKTNPGTVPTFVFLNTGDVYSFPSIELKGTPLVLGKEL
jgi:hypothetical protein